MKRTIKLNENDLTRIVKRVIKETQLNEVLGLLDPDGPQDFEDIDGVIIRDITNIRQAKKYCAGTKVCLSDPRMWDTHSEHGHTFKVYINPTNGRRVFEDKEKSGKKTFYSEKDAYLGQSEVAAVQYLGKEIKRNWNVD